MIKTLANVLKQDREKFAVPRKVQDIIPVRSIWPDGIFMTGKNRFTKMYRFSDINYAVASRSDKEGMFLGYSELLNSLDSGCTAKITIINRRLNMLDFADRILIKMINDMLDRYRKEINGILTDKATGANSMIQEKFITISVNRRNIEDARLYFARIGADLSAHFARLGSKCTELNCNDRLRIIHDFFRAGEETSYHFDLKDHMQKGHDFRDYICPDSYENHSDYFKVGNRFGRVLLLHVIRDDCREVVVHMLFPLPVGDVGLYSEQSLLDFFDRLICWDRYDIYGKHQVPVDRCHLRYHVIGYIRSIIPKQ